MENQTTDTPNNSKRKWSKPENDFSISQKFENSMADVKGNEGGSPFVRNRGSFDRGGGRGRGRGSPNFGRGSRPFNRGGGRGFGRGGDRPFGRGGGRPFGRGGGGGRGFNRDDNGPFNRDSRPRGNFRGGRGFNNRGKQDFNKSWHGDQENDKEVTFVNKRKTFGGVGAELTDKQADPIIKDVFEKEVDSSLDETDTSESEEIIVEKKPKSSSAEDWVMVDNPVKDETSEDEDAESEDEVQQISDKDENESSDSEEEIVVMDVKKSPAVVGNAKITKKNKGITVAKGEAKTDISTDKIGKDVCNRSISVSNIQPLIKESHLTQLFSKYGPIESVTLADSKIISKKTKSSGYSVITFAKREDALKAVEVTGMEYKGYHLIVQMHGDLTTLHPNKTVHVDDLPLDVDKDRVWTKFESCGVITNLHTTSNVKWNKSYAFITFESPNSVQFALAMDKIKFQGAILQVSRYAFKKKKQQKKVAKPKKTPRRQGPPLPIKVQKNKSQKGQFIITADKKRKLPGAKSKKQRVPKVKSGFVAKKK